MALWAGQLMTTYLHMPHLFLLLLLVPIAGMAQRVTHGPVTGAMTHTSARMYVRTDRPAMVTLQVLPMHDRAVASVFLGRTVAERDTSVILELDRLRPDTRYRYLLIVEQGTDSVAGSFRTFPEPGKGDTLVFVTGSCQETENMKVFDVMPLHRPYFLMHTGDFTYPDYQIAPDYSKDMAGVALAYRRRYSEKRMDTMLLSIPIDYMHDDNDYVGGSGGRYCKNDMRSSKRKGKVYNEMMAPPFPPQWRRNVIHGYHEYFPHYPLPDTSEGIYHRFSFGNADFFVIDRNSAKDRPNMDAFRYDAKRNRWSFDPPPGYALFGRKQMDWLKQEISASKADWKFIVSGVPLNGALKTLIDAGIRIQKWNWGGWYGFHMAWGFAQYWCAYAEERDDFMQYLSRNGIKDVVVISGDTHHNVMDDGTNAGLPEMNASGLSVSSTELSYYLRVIGNVSRLYDMDKLWNKGGNGLHNKNNRNAFGKVTIVGRKYVEMSIIDEDNEVISSFRVPHSSAKAE